MKPRRWERVVGPNALYWAVTFQTLQPQGEAAQAKPTPTAAQVAPEAAAPSVNGTATESPGALRS